MILFYRGESIDIVFVRFIGWIHGSIILFHRYARFNWNAVQTATGTSRGSNIYRCASRVKYPQALFDSCEHYFFFFFFALDTIIVDYYYV